MKWHGRMKHFACHFNDGLVSVFYILYIFSTVKFLSELTSTAAIKFRDI